MSLLSVLSLGTERATIKFSEGAISHIYRKMDERSCSATLFKKRKSIDENDSSNMDWALSLIHHSRWSIKSSSPF